MLREIMPMAMNPAPLQENILLLYSFYMCNIFEL